MGNVHNFVGIVGMGGDPVVALGGRDRCPADDRQLIQKGLRPVKSEARAFASLAGRNINFQTSRKISEHGRASGKLLLASGILSFVALSCQPGMWSTGRTPARGIVRRPGPPAVPGIITGRRDNSETY